MIDWKTQPEAYAKLPENIKSKIRALGLNPEEISALIKLTTKEID